MRRTGKRSLRLVGMLMVLLTVAIAAQPFGVSAQTTATGQGTSPQTAGSATVEFSDVWQYDAESSDPETVFLSHLDLPGTAFIYAEITDPIPDANAALAEFTDGFFGAFGDGDHTVVDSGVVPTNTAWQLFSVSLDTVPFGIYASANVTDIPGDVVVTLLMSPAGSYDLAVTSVQDGISVNGAGTSLSSFDPLALSNAIQDGGTTAQTPADPLTNQTPAATVAETPAAPPAEPTRGGLTLPPLGGESTVTATTSQGAAGSVADFQAADAQGTCDAIGWVVTSPEQFPATEADIDFRATCVGGGAYVSFCGTVASGTLVTPEPGMVWIRCDVTARAVGVPLAISPLDFSLMDGAGTEYTLDFTALFGVSNPATFPEADVPAGQTGGGTVAFAVPDTATGPWVLLVSPASLPETGEQAGQLVVEGELQPFDVFGR